MASDLRLHPLSFLFELGTHAKALLWPGIVAFFAASSGRGQWEVWAMVLIVPYALSAIVRAVAFRYAFGPGELVIRTGVLFRRERHIPYDRIQNIDATENLAHRLLGVVAVRLETGGGTEAEAQLKVLSVAAFRELRERIFAGRTTGVPAAPEAAVMATASAVPDTLLAMSTREVALWGLIRGQGMVVVAAGFGVLLELGVIDRVSRAMFGDAASARGVLRQLARAAFGQGIAPTQKVFIACAAFAALVVAMRLLAVGLALVRFHGFTLAKAGDDLRSEFGLLTRVSMSVPAHRIQTLTVHEGPLHRLFRRSSLTVETAGGEAEESSRERRQWLAPLVRNAALDRVIRVAVPAFDLERAGWRPVHPRAFRRVLVKSLVVSIVVSAALLALLRWWALAAFAVLAAWSVVAARMSVARMGWALTDQVVVYRSGWIWRRVTAAPFAKVQAVALGETPFDRRHGMASVNVDTAGASDAAHRVRIRYLAREDADALREHLASAAARTVFEW